MPERTEMSELPVEYEEMKVIEPDFKVLFGALAYEVGKIYFENYRGNTVELDKHLENAQTIINGAYNFPLIMKE